MKTTLNDEKDIQFLKIVLRRCIMQGEQFLFDYAMVKNNNLHEYCNQLLKIRKKCYEWLGEEDPNEETLKKLNNNLRL